jgi:DNA-binding response OmpR family regulator
MRVLLIEDDSAAARSIELMLKSETFNVYTTDFGEEGTGTTLRGYSGVRFRSTVILILQGHHFV